VILPQLTIALPTSTFLPAIGGVEIGLHNIAIRLSQHGHKPTVIAPASHVYNLRRQHLSLPYKLIGLPPKTLTLAAVSPEAAMIFLSSYFHILQWKHNFDVWHGTVGYPVGTALARFGFNNVPHIIRCAGDDIQMDKGINYGMRINPRIDKMIRKWLPRADAMVAITESVQQEYEKIGIPHSKILRIPNGVSLERFENYGCPAAIRKKYNIPQEAFLFLTVGRNHPKKGFADLIRAAALLRNTATEPFAVVIAGANTGSLSALIKQERLGDTIFCLGEIGSGTQNAINSEWPSQDLIDLYNAADAFIFPSYIESFGIALIEAMAAGLPVITTDGPGCIDVIDNGSYGEMVPVGEPSALARAMHRLHTDEELRTHYVHASKKRAKDFSWNSIVRQYITAYQTLISKSSL